MKPYDWQAYDLDRIEAAGYRALVNVEPGGGKTAISAWAIERSGAEVVLVVAPKQTFESAWQEDVRRAIGREVRIIGNGKKAEREALADFELGYPGIYVCSPQFMTRADVSAWSGDMLIVDEHHLVNAAKSKGQRQLTGYYPRDWDTALAYRFPMRLALSGTSWRNSFSRAWATMRLLWPEYDGPGQIADANYYRWLNDRLDNVEVYTNQRDANGMPKKVKKFLNEKNPGQLISEMPCAITHFRRKNCCSFHPEGFLPTDEPVVKEHTLALHKDQTRAIEELEEFYMTWLDGQPLSVDLSITQQQRIRQLCLGVPDVEYYEEDGEEKVRIDFDVDCVSPFYDRFREILDDLPEDEPVVAFVESQKFAAVLTEKLNRDGVSAFEYSGKTVKTREQDKAEFGSKYRVAVIVIAAGGTGMSGLHYVAKTEVWFERSVDETNNTQAEGRVDRLGGVGQVERHYLLDEGGRAAGRMSEQLEKRRALAKTLQVRR